MVRFFFIGLFSCVLSQLSAGSLFLEINGAAFRPNSPTFRRVYHDYQGLYSLEATVPVYSYLTAWANAGYLLTKGHSLGYGNPTSLQYVPAGAGLGANFPLMKNWIYLQLNAGPLFGYAKFHNHSPYVIQHQSKFNVGGVFKGKFVFILPGSIYLDLFADYSILKLPFHSSWGGTVVPQHVDLSGISFGLGLGYFFPPATSEMEIKQPRKKWRWR